MTPRNTNTQRDTDAAEAKTYGTSPHAYTSGSEGNRPGLGSRFPRVYSTDLKVNRVDAHGSTTEDINSNAGEDEPVKLSRRSSNSGGGESIEFNGSLLICINGSPYWIDIPYDADTGPYDGTGSANFPITAP